ncbi:jmjC domain containing protein [Paecilomyces variotii No. 5]|uniref:JmjC domain containing protein n=1 Tax=Byssochlamys spectabilis (strain No. 5 / NBRC 109023) TaxID=1356009 RepID=V5FDS6_BYSSN|nr:jmjC domain containing protein [Paecilomyces variotii No. 5]
MPAQRPCAAFEPLPPDLDVTALVESTPNFEFAVRIHCDAIDEQGLENFEKLVLLHVILGGKPLVIEGYEDRLEKWTFSEQWLRDNHAKKTETARDLSNKTNIPLTIGHYLNNLPLLTDQWNAHNYKDPKRQRIYLKDIDCPPVWHDKLRELIPPLLFYLNKSTGETGGPGAKLEPNSHGAGTRSGKGIAKAGDLMSSLPPAMRADNLMCYIGHEGTYTPAHREMCASLGHNIMVEASTGLMEHGKPTKPGSSIWFMTESKDRFLVSEYWLSTLGHDIEIEKHFAQINAWKAAPFKTYVVEQKPGDFILIPPLAPHQVWNRGTRTMKVAWNRTTVETLELALNEALPRARMVCRDEQYKNKAIIFFSLDKYSKLLRQVQEFSLSGPKIRQLQKDFRRLFGLYTKILLSESFSIERPDERNIQFLPYDSYVTCSYCRCNIFNRFLTCPSCVGKLPSGEEDNYDICMECYAMGRSCACISKLKWVQQFRWKELVEKHELWRKQIVNLGGLADNAIKNFHQERKNVHDAGIRTLAEICQDELRKRPWVDITKPQVLEEPEEDDVDDEGKPRKRKKPRSEKGPKRKRSCHICRAFDIMPQQVMEQRKWLCPKCQKICSCAACRRDPSMNPFAPKGTLLGHDTRKIADPRSVESLADFSHSNIAWLKKAGDGDFHNSRRLQVRLEEAEHAKSNQPVLGDHYVQLTRPASQEASTLHVSEHRGIPVDPALAVGTQENASVHVHSQGDIPIDPALGGGFDDPHLFVPKNGVLREDMRNEYEATEAITFEYPDPEGPSIVAPDASQQTVWQPLSEIPENSHGPSTEKITMTDGNGKKRKRTSEHVKVQNGFNMIYDGPGDDAPSRRKSSSSKRAGSKRKASDKPAAQDQVSTAIEAVKMLEDSIRVTSDILNNSQGSFSLKPEIQGRRSKARGGEDDDEFTPVKRDRRRSQRPAEPIKSKRNPPRATKNRQAPPIQIDDLRSVDSGEEIQPETVNLESLTYRPSSPSETSSGSAESVDDAAYPIPDNEPSHVPVKPGRLTEAEENRRAKLLAMQWAAGQFDDLEEEWSSPDERPDPVFPNRGGRNAQATAAMDASGKKRISGTNNAAHIGRNGSLLPNTSPLTVS